MSFERTRVELGWRRLRNCLGAVSRCFPLLESERTEMWNYGDFSLFDGNGDSLIMVLGVAQI